MEVERTGEAGSVQAAPLQRPPDLNQRLGRPEGASGCLLEAGQAMANRVRVDVELGGGRFDAAVIDQVALGCAQQVLASAGIQAGGGPRKLSR